MYYIIYKITNNINKKFYIGKHKTKKLDDRYMGSGKLIRAAIKKYGIENFTKEILFICENEQVMNAKEKELVETGPNSYNLCPGGKGGWGYINENGLTDHKLARKKADESILQKYGVDNPAKIPEVKTKFSKSMKEQYRLGLRKCDTFTGKKHKSETIEDMKNDPRRSHKGAENGMFQKMWITNGKEDKVISKTEISFWESCGFVSGRSYPQKNKSS